MNTKRALTTLSLAAAALALPLATTAGAESIVYIDGGNVWSAAPDGSARAQLTEGGSWHSPTQSDDGTIAAVQGAGPIQIMARDGRPIRSITTEPAKSGDGGTLAARPVALSLSPDGTRLAYSYTGLSCPVGSTCGTEQLSTFYTATNVTQATPQATYGNQYGVGDAEWVTNARTLVFGGAGSQVSIDDLGPGDYSHKAWMTPPSDMGDGEVSRDGRRLAATWDYGENKIIAFFTVSGDVRTETPPPAPHAVCTTGKDAKNADPSWSPDGSGIAFQDSAGIHVVRFTAFGPEDCAVGPDVVFAATGSSPDWGPAAPAGARYVPIGSVPGGGVTGGVSSGPGGTSLPGGAGSGSAPTPDAVPFTIAKVTRAALRKGLAVKVTAAKGDKISVRISAAGRKVAKTGTRAKRTGQTTVRLPKVATAKAAKLRGQALTIEVTVGGRTSSRKVTVG